MRLFKFLPKDCDNFFVHIHHDIFFFVIQCVVVHIKRVGCTQKIDLSIPAEFAAGSATVILKYSLLS